MKLDVHCAKCSAEKEHSIFIDEKTPAKVIVTATCDSCGNVVTLPLLAGRRRDRFSVADRVKMLLARAAHRRKIIKGKP